MPLQFHPSPPPPPIRLPFYHFSFLPPPPLPSPSIPFSLLHPPSSFSFFPEFFLLILILVSFFNSLDCNLIYFNNILK